MNDYQEDRKPDRFMLITPLDEDLIIALDIEPSTPRGKVIELIKEYICRRGKKCSLCGKTHNRRDLTIDRRKPISHGGRDNIENLQLLCHNCSELKGNSTMLQVRKRLREQKNKR